MFGFSYLGRAITRNAGEADAAYALRTQTEILRERGTRAGMIKALSDLTGSAPSIFEPWNTNDAGALNNGTVALGGPSLGVSVSGSITPDLTGNYYIAGTYNGNNYYTSINGLYLAVQFRWQLLDYIGFSWRRSNP